MKMQSHREQRRTNDDGTNEGSLLAILTREDDRRLRAQAWRHVHRINAAIARRVWRNHRNAS